MTNEEKNTSDERPYRHTWDWVLSGKKNFGPGNTWLDLSNIYGVENV